MPSLEGKGRNELIDINGCGFDQGKREGGRERERETDGKDEKAEKITLERSRC